jgi:hypothetical protein
VLLLLFLLLLPQVLVQVRSAQGQLQLLHVQLLLPASLLAVAEALHLLPA